MTELFSSFPGKTERYQEQSTEPKLVSLNDVLQHALLAYQQAIKKGDLVIRTEVLPAVLADRQQINLLIQNALGLIITEKTGVGKQFVHVDCNAMDDEVMDLSIQNGFRRFQLNFKTNIKCGAIAEQNEQQLQQCAAILQHLNGKISVNDNEEQKCWLKIFLPGKFLS